MAIPRSWRRAIRAARMTACAGMSLPLFVGCSLLTPLPAPTRIADRLAQFPKDGLPIEGVVLIRWNDHQIPFIEAEHDGDAAFALGLVHAHLRLGQMMLARQIAYGRVAEIAGPVAIDLDRTLRTIGLARAADEIVRRLPPATASWLERFVEGVNVYQARAAERPHEHRVAGRSFERWSPRDVIAIGRLGGIDVSWGQWLSLLPLVEEPDWPEIWRRAIEPGGENPASFGADVESAMRVALAKGEPLVELLRQVARTGSNSVAVSGDRTRSGGALIANDPHLGFLLPNFWLIAGLRSPSYEVVGLMAPGLPVFALGRNPDLAWGGTNLYAASSDLVDVTHLDSDAFEIEEELLGVRFWPDRRVRRRISPYGPLLNDAPLFSVPGERRLALRWIGHEPTDEVSALLATMRATDVDEARSALAGYALPALNWIVADRDGRVAHFLATQLPKRPDAQPADLIVSTAQADRDWVQRLDATTLPAAVDPPPGFVASANNRPTRETPSPIGYFFGAPDRILRMQELLGHDATVRLEDLAALQRDVVSVSAREIAARLRMRGAWPAALGDFAGEYRIDSRAALQFEAFLVEFAPMAFREADALRTFDSLRSGASLKARLLTLIEDLPAPRLAALSESAWRRARESPLGDDRWGDRHRLVLGHPFSRVPLLGRRYARIDKPAPGSGETLQKTAHPLTAERHASFFGSQSRHLSDLSDLDANYFVLVGGQDGWLGSENFDDQIPLWRAGGTIRMPLSRARVAEEFPHPITLEPTSAK